MAQDYKHYDTHDAGPEWATPPYLWEPLADALGGFDLDPAAGAEDLDPDAKRIADTRFTVEDDGLAQEWFGDVWVNPPYGRGFNDEWAAKIGREARAPRTDTVTALVPAAMSTDRFHEPDGYGTADLYTFIDHRVSFLGSEDKGASFASVILTYGDVPDAYVAALDDLGLVLADAPTP